MQERHLCWSPYFFPWPRSGPPTFSFYCRIATVCRHQKVLCMRISSSKKPDAHRF